MALTDNIVAFWKLDESSGDAADSVGSQTLTNENSVSYTAALINNGADFGTGNTNKRLTAVSNLGISGGTVTISIWVKLNEEINSGAWTFFSIQSVTNYVGYYIDYEYNSGTRRLIFRRQRQNVANDDSYYTVTLGTSNWYHLVLTYDTSEVKGYINTTATTPTSSTGNGSGGYAANFTGIGGIGGQFSSSMIDVVGVWSSALTSGEVSSLYNSGAGTQYPFAPTYSLTADTQSYTLTGKDVSLDTVTSFTMAAEVGEFTLTGVDVSLAVAIDLGHGTFLLTGKDSILKSSITIFNTSKPSSSMVNVNRIQSYETWDSNVTTWDSETRTWDEMGTKMANTSKVSSSIVNTSKP